MAIQKKHGKGRLDKWYKLAKEKGYRARAAFKLVQLNKRFGFLEKSRVCIDLCAAPGSWCQVAAETMPTGSLIVGVDLSPIKPIPRVITFQSDIATEKCRATIRSHLKTWKADIVLHDGAPNVGTAWVQDSYNQAELVLHSLKLATEFLIKGGWFVTKVFRSKDYNPLLWVFNQLFERVEATSPPASRTVSAEIFVACRGFKAPLHIDPRLLDPRSVFADLKDPAANSEAKVYKPEMKKRKRDGYEEGNYTQFKEVLASEFIQTTDPISILGSTNRLSFKQGCNGNVTLAALNKLPETTDEIRNCCADLKVLGRKEFKLLLKWRLRAREIFGFPTKKTAKTEEVEETAEVEPMDEEMKLQQDLQNMKDKDDAKKRRQRRKENEKKQKAILRLQMGMTAPMDIGLEQEGPMGPDAMFRLKDVDGSVDAKRRIAKGRMMVLTKAEAKRDLEFDSGLGSSGETDDVSDQAEDELENELDRMYETYVEKKSAVDAKYRAKRARKEHDDEEWEGVSASDNGDDPDSGLEEDSSEGGNGEDDEDALAGKPLIRDLKNEPENTKAALSIRARNFFSQDVFKGIPGLLDAFELEEEEEAGEDEGHDRDQPDQPEAAGLSEDELPSIAKQRKMQAAAVAQSKEDDDGKIEVVNEHKSVKEDEEDWEDEDKRKQDKRKQGVRTKIDIITAEAMTLAHQLATGEKSAYDLRDEAFNKNAFKQTDGLPEWFLDDESKHNRPLKPITKAAADAIKERIRAYNARPIKKVREAKARKKFKAAQRLEKLRKKGEKVMTEDGLSERDKASTIAKLMKSASKKIPQRRITVVKAGGTNKGKGRPKGVKGRYKMVDPRMRKELRAMKRVAKKQKKR